MRYTPAQKAVAAFVAVGRPKAGELLQHLSRAEVSKLLAVSRTMSAIPQDALDQIVGEFETEFTRGSGLLDSSTQLDSLMAESFDEADMAALRGESGAGGKPKDKKRSAWEVLAGTEAAVISTYLEAESAQVGAFVLSELASSQAAEILGHMDRAARAQIIARMMSVAEVSSSAKEFLEAELVEQFGQSKAGSNKAALMRVATILNEMERGETESMLGELSQSVDAVEISTVKSMLFRFEDIIALDAAARTMVLDAVPTDVLTMGLRDAGPEITEAILSSISQRTRRMIENDLKSKIQVRAADIAAARKRIVGEVLKLAGAGRVELPKQELEAA